MVLTGLLFCFLVVRNLVSKSEKERERIVNQLLIGRGIPLATTYQLGQSAILLVLVRDQVTVGDELLTDVGLRARIDQCHILGTLDAVTRMTEFRLISALFGTLTTERAIGDVGGLL